MATEIELCYWLIRRFVTCLVVVFVTNQALHPVPSKKPNSSLYRRLWQDETRPVTLTLLFPTPSHTLPRKQYTPTQAHNQQTHTPLQISQIKAESAVNLTFLQPKIQLQHSPTLHLNE